mmetsp:Transcript_115239/g.357928  ORF Transcript_115239/g.357928 Transcript_115239/m.357928 type:complete len:116 (-) Transcript_115239:186-533(-)
MVSVCRVSVFASCVSSTRWKMLPVRLPAPFVEAPLLPTEACLDTTLPAAAEPACELLLLLPLLPLSPAATGDTTPALAYDLHAEGTPLADASATVGPSLLDLGLTPPAAPSAAWA